MCANAAYSNESERAPGINGFKNLNDTSLLVGRV